MKNIEAKPAQLTLWPEIHIVPCRKAGARPATDDSPAIGVQLSLELDLPVPVPPFRSIQELTIGYLEQLAGLYAANDPQDDLRIEGGGA